MDKSQLFASPLYRQSLADAEQINRQLKADILAWSEEDATGHSRSNRGSSWHSTTDAFKRPTFHALTAAIVNAATEIFRIERYPGTGRVRLVEMWANINAQGGWNAPHSHGKSLWSGVYYVDCPAGAPDITFLCPFAGNDDLMVPSTHREPVKPGQMLFFPSWLVHYVDPHLGLQPRISVSFNLQRVTPEKKKTDTPHFVEVPQLLSRDDVIRVYSQIAGLEWGKGLVGTGEASNNRINRVLFVQGKDPESPWHWLYEKIKDEAETVSSETFKLDISGGGDMQFARYGPEGKYDTHIDRGSTAPTRSLSCSIVLRPAERGGGIRFPESAAQPEHKAAGDAVFFGATERHEVLPVKEGVRDSLIVWFNETRSEDERPPASDVP